VNAGRQEKLSDVTMFAMVGKRSNHASIYEQWPAREAIRRHHIRHGRQAKQSESNNRQNEFNVSD